MKLLLASVLMLTTAANVSASDNIMTLDDLRKADKYVERVQANESKRANNLAQSQTITTEKQSVQAEQLPRDTLNDTAFSALRWGAVAAGMGLTYFYGPTALFWGTYYGVTWGMGKIGITGVTALVAATKAGTMVAESGTACAALTAASGLVAKHGASTALTIATVTGKVACAGASYLAEKSWSLGNYAYNSYLGKEPTEEVKQSPKTPRELAADAAEKRHLQHKVQENLANHSKLVQVLGI